MDVKLENTSLWPMTDWSALGRAGDAVGKETAPLDELIRRYQKPLTVYVTFKFPSLAHESERLVMEFAENKILKEGWLKKPQSSRGRFRDFLKRCLFNFVAEGLRKRDLNKEAISLDELEQEIQAPSAVGDLFDLDWTKMILAEALQRTADDCQKPDKDQPRRGYIWEVFRIRIVLPLLEDAKPWPYEKVVEHFKLRSPNEASNMLLTAKRMFHRHLLAVISEYEGQEKVADELGDLKRLLARLVKKS